MASLTLSFATIDIEEYFQVTETGWLELVREQTRCDGISIGINPLLIVMLLMGLPAV